MEVINYVSFTPIMSLLIIYSVCVYSGQPWYITSTDHRLISIGWLNINIIFICYLQKSLYTYRSDILIRHASVDDVNDTTSSVDKSLQYVAPEDFLDNKIWLNINSAWKCLINV